MQVNGLSGAGSKTAGIKMAQKMDSFSINIKNEIARKQKEQQEISSNKSLSAEEKMKKRQEIQRQINDLYNQLRQHQIEQRREKQQAEMSAGNNRAAANEDKQTAGLSQASMESMISADSAMAQAKVQGRAVTGMEGRIRGLKAEIRQDAGSGSSVKKKQEELEKLEQKKLSASASQMNTLGTLYQKKKRMRIRKLPVPSQNASIGKRQVILLKAEQVIRETANLCRDFGAKEVILYGSRAKETARERSDIDIAVTGVKDFDALVEEVENLPTLYSVDMVNMDTCKNQLLLEDIRQYGRKI